MAGGSLQAVIDRVGSPVALLRDSPARPHTFPVAPELTNWRSEQHAWRTSCVLFDQSHHMTALRLTGPDALRLLSDFGVNSFAKSVPGRAKQHVAGNADGRFIGDAILFHLADNVFDVIGHRAVPDWLRYALSAIESRRVKVTLVWHPDDVAAVTRSLYEPGIPAKYLEMPKARYAFYQVDTVLRDDRPVGMSLDVGCLANEHAFVPLATVDADAGEPGTEVTVLWGEEPSSAKPAVERHRQVPIGATVAPAPFVREVRESYRTSITSTEAT